MQIQTQNPGKYNIGQQGRIIKSALTCQMPPYLRLVNQCKDKDGFVTYDNGEVEADIGNLLGGVWVPMEALIF